jgi:centromeric protein E
MSLSSKRAANPVSSPPPNATKRPRGDNAKASAGGEDAAKPPEKADNGDALGRIFVAVRIRPLNAREREGSSAEHATPRFSALDGTRVVETRPAREDDAFDAAPTAAPAWEADAVFDRDDDNAAVYGRTAKSVVDAVLRGVNGTVMAYGQTSSGKTHTMSGTATDPGVMTRAVEDIFAAVAAAGATRAFAVKASYMEIYNEEIRDLLAPDAPEERGAFNNTFSNERNGVNTSVTQSSHIKLVNGPRGLTQVIGLEERIVTDSAQIIDLVEEGTLKRSVGRTAMNATSSRSHAVLRISVSSTPNPGHALSGPPRSSTLYVVDLAGSERADPNAARTKKLVQLKKEGSNINQSLLTLRLCVQRLAKASGEAAEPVGHVPYRDSKLTRILQPALAGPGRTAIVAAVTPASSHVNETYSTLNFVAVAKSVKMEARVNRTGAGSKTHDSEALKELQAVVAAEAIRRKSLEEEHERVLEEMSNVGARLSAAESRADAAAAAAEFAERAAASARERAKAADARAEAAEKERDATAAHAASAASRFMEAKTGSRADAAALREALEALEAEKAKAIDAEEKMRKELDLSAASLAQAQEETARAQAECVAAKEAEDAALSTAARELEAAAAARASLETKMRGEIDAEKARCVAMKASLERARGRVVEAEKVAKVSKEELAEMSVRVKRLEDALEEAREGKTKMTEAEKKQLTIEVERRVSVEQALDASERRCVVLDAELSAAKESLTRAETNAENAVVALEQERSAAKELDEAATMALGEVERLAAEAERLEKELEKQTALADEARVDLEMAREELLEATRGEVQRGDDVSSPSKSEKTRLLSEELEAARVELASAAERAAAELAAATSAARAAAAGEAAALARAEELESELKSLERRVRDIEADAASRVADANDAAEAASLEARMLKETNEEMMGFVAELERVSQAATAEAEDLRARVHVDRRRSTSACADAPPGSPFSPGVTVKASMPMRASKAKAESAASRAERVEAESAEGVEAAVVVPAASLSAAHATTVETVEAVVATADPPEEAPKKRGRGRPKKVRTEAEQRLVDLKTKKKKVSETSSGKENDKENAGAVGGFSLKSLIVAAGAPKKRPVLGLADANATPSAKEKGVPAKTKRRRLANVSSLRDVIGSPLENGRFLR